MERAAVESATITLMLKGAIKPRLKNIVISQKTKTAKNRGEIVLDEL
jgi:hypothetical protein